MLKDKQKTATTHIVEALYGTFIYMRTGVQFFRKFTVQDECTKQKKNKFFFPCSST